MSDHDIRSFNLVLAIHPTKFGFGWALFETPLKPVEWGTAAVSHNRNARCLKRIESIIGRFRPTEILVEEFDSEASRRHNRIRHLYRSIIRLARSYGIDTRTLTREAIEEVFARFDAKDRYKIAAVIAHRIDAFSHLLPPKRKIWDAESPRMGLFNAAALAITFFALIDGEPFAN
jgi:hypothetical protein